MTNIIGQKAMRVDQHGQIAPFAQPEAWDDVLEFAIGARLVRHTEEGDLYDVGFTDGEAFYLVQTI